MYEIQRMTTRQRHEQQTRTYRVLIDIAEEVAGNARAGLEKTGMMRGKDMLADMAIAELRRQIGHFCHLGDRVIDQARRRALWRAGRHEREDPFHLRAPHRPDQARQGAYACRVRPQVFLAESAQKVVCIPQRGGKRMARRAAYEKSVVFKTGQRFRAGIEGRISVLFRGRGMKRWLAE
jgi:IS5 family transposase